ncbi:MAG: hypothetical protein ACN2B6_12115 [Rickettsiales bacterium]
MPLGRPTDYNEDTTAELCARIALGNSLRSVCKSDDMPAIATVYKWFAKYPDFVEQYARAKEDSADSDADRIEEIAEKVLDGEYEPAQARTAIDAYKWTAGKKRPRRYGDKIQTEHSGSVGYTDMTDEQLNNKLQSLINATQQPKP